MEQAKKFKATLKPVGAGILASFEGAWVVSCGAVLETDKGVETHSLAGHARSHGTLLAAMVVRLMERCKQLGCNKLEVEAVQALMDQLGYARMARPYGCKRDGSEFADWDIYEKLNEAVDEGRLFIFSVKKQYQKGKAWSGAREAANTTLTSAKAYELPRPIAPNETLLLWVSDADCIAA